MKDRHSLTRFAWLSIAAAAVTIALKMLAYRLTGSVSLLSDALESFANLGAAMMALAMLVIANRPPDDDHAYGHSKAEYFSSAVEGLLILVAAASILWAAIPRLSAPQPLEAVGLGLTLSTLGSLVNFVVARVLVRAGRRYQSISLEADGQHLMTDVWTSLGVLVGIGLVLLTGWTVLDPLVALLVASNIIWTGVRLIRRSVLGLLDTAIPADEQRQVREILDRYSAEGMTYHALRTRQAAARRFVSVHLLVPNNWTVQQGHALAERVEEDIRRELRNTTVFTHLEPHDDPLSLADLTLDRHDATHTTTLV